MNPAKTLRIPGQDLDPTLSARLVAALEACRNEYDRARKLPQDTDTEHAVRAGRLALVCAREAAWLGVLARHTYRDFPRDAQLYGPAVVIAEQVCRDRARFWRDSAADWWARAQRRPTSELAGAMCNRAELGVA